LELAKLEFTGVPSADFLEHARSGGHAFVLAGFVAELAVLSYATLLSKAWLEQTVGLLTT
jgi:hypothetical protein